MSGSNGMSKSYNSNRAAMTSKVGKSKLKLGYHPDLKHQQLKFTEFSAEEELNTIENIRFNSIKNNRLELIKGSLIVVGILILIYLVIE